MSNNIYIRSTYGKWYTTDSIDQVVYNYSERKRSLVLQKVW